MLCISGILLKVRIQKIYLSLVLFKYCLWCQVRESKTLIFKCNRTCKVRTILRSWELLDVSS
jgi:hypothetical protein